MASVIGGAALVWMGTWLLEDSQSAFATIGLALPLGSWLLLPGSKGRDPLSTRFGFAFVCLAVLGVPAIQYHVRSFEVRAEQTIRALEAYRSEHGHYPERARGEWGSVQGIEFPECPDGMTEPSYSATADEFSLTCVTFGFSKHTYESEQQRWVSWD